MPPPRRRRAQTPRQRAPTREGPSFFDTMSQVGRQRAAQPPQRTPTNIPGRPVQTGRTEGGFAPVQAPIGQQNQYVGPTPMEAWESNLGGSPSFAQTMGQMGARPSAPIKSRPLRDVTSDAQHAASLAGRLPSATPLAQVLGLNQVSPAGQANLEINRWDPNKRGYYVPDVDRQSPAFTNQQSVPLQVAPMLNVFRNNPQAMESLLYGGHSMPGYQPRRFYDSNQQIDSSNYWEHRIPSPWETYSPIMGSSASHEYDVGAPYGRGYYDWGHLANQAYPTQGMPWPDTSYPSFQQGSKPPWMTDPWNVSPSQYFAEGSMFRTPPRGGL